MIDLNDDNDPMLFAVNTPNGQLIVQYMEVVASLQSVMTDSKEPTPSDICNAIRSNSRTHSVASLASDAILFAAWHRMTMRVNEKGNG
jgi:hypothetical protein